jgi:hypothetical protein
MPRNKNERHGTSTWHKGTAADLSIQELNEIIALLQANEQDSSTPRNGRKSIRMRREEYETELRSRLDKESDSR